MANANMVRWYFCTKSIYDKLVEDNKVNPEGMYFLSDTNEYFYKNVNYMRNVVFISGNDFPEEGITSDHIYFNTTNLTAYTYDANNSEWDVLVEPAKVTVLRDANNGVTQMVLGSAVKTYVDDLLDHAIDGAVINISWNSTTNSITFNRHVNENGTVSLLINQFAKTIERDGATGDIYIIAGDGTTRLSQINIPLDNYTISGIYDDTENAIVFTMSNGASVKIYANSIVQLYNAVVTNTITTTIQTENSQNTISFDVRLSSVSGNEIELIPANNVQGATSGLYANRAHLMDFISPARDGAVTALNSQGNSKDTGKSIGGNNISAIAANRPDLLVTEAALKAVDTNHRTLLADTYVPLASVATQYSNFSSAMKVVAQS